VNTFQRRIWKLKSAHTTLLKIAINFHFERIILNGPEKNVQISISK